MTINEIMEELRTLFTTKPIDMDKVCRQFYMLLDDNISEKIINIMIKYSSYCMDVDNTDEILNTIQEDLRECVFENLLSPKPLQIDNLKEHITVKISTPRRVEIAPGNWIDMKGNEIISTIANEFKDLFMNLFETDTPPLVLFKCKDEDKDLQGRMDHIFYTLGTYHYTRIAVNQAVTLKNIGHMEGSMENAMSNMVIYDMDPELKNETLSMIDQIHRTPNDQGDEIHRKLTENLKTQILKKGSELYVELMQNLG